MDELPDGSGSTAPAALETARGFVGYEIDEIYCQLALAQLQKVSEQATSA